MNKLSERSVMLCDYSLWILHSLSTDPLQRSKRYPVRLALSSYNMWNVDLSLLCCRGKQTRFVGASFSGNPSRSSNRPSGQTRSTYKGRCIHVSKASRRLRKKHSRQDVTYKRHYPKKNTVSQNQQTFLALHRQGCRVSVDVSDHRISAHMSLAWPRWLLLDLDKEGISPRSKRKVSSNVKFFRWKKTLRPKNKVCTAVPHPSDIMCWLLMGTQLTAWCVFAVILANLWRSSLGSCYRRRHEHVNINYNMMWWEVITEGVTTM